MGGGINDDADLRPLLVGDITGNFFVPAYQRGYRWGEDEVRRLLDDIDGSLAGGEDYYLQPVVVKRRTDGKWELVDGQQRLTTLFLILRYMQLEGLQGTGPAYSIEYETRAESHGYLLELDEKSSGANIDFFHIFAAYQCIGRWFDHHGARKQYAANKLYQSFFETVRVIWYEAPSDLDATDLFIRLNVGRIPLTDAELVKAMLLSNSHGTSGVSDRAYEIAAQWDNIERDLRVPELWAFATGKSDDQATHISLLLDTLVGGPTGRDRPIFYTFETLREKVEGTTAHDARDDSVQTAWDEVVRLHSLLTGWYEDRSLFHKIGYLIASGTPFHAIVDLARYRTKSSFEAHLDERIRGRLNLTEDELRELSYDQDYDKCTQVLLLMNVETVRKRQNSSERYSFRAHATGSWSLEHIDAQASAPLATAQQWTAWLEMHRDALATLPEVDSAQREELVARIETALRSVVTENMFRTLEEAVIMIFRSAAAQGDDTMHSISNLALLDRNDNSALSNAVFEVKRLEILRRDRAGAFIPACTRNVFLKYYTNVEGQHIHFWGSADRDAYITELLALIDPYLTPASVTA